MEVTSYFPKGPISSLSGVFSYMYSREKRNREDKVVNSMYYDELDLQSIRFLTNSYKVYTNADGSSMDVSTYFIPKTDFVKKLLSIRKKYIENGGTLLSLEEIDNEVKIRRGGMFHDEENIS